MLAQPLVRFVVPSGGTTYPDSNSRFSIDVIFTANYFFSGRQRPC
jgi:hypothetical protein